MKKDIKYVDIRIIGTKEEIKNFIELTGKIEYLGFYEKKATIPIEVDGTKDKIAFAFKNPEKMYDANGIVGQITSGEVFENEKRNFKEQVDSDEIETHLINKK